MKPIVRKTLKIIGWITVSIIFLLVLVFILIQIPAVQNFAKNKIVAYLENKIKTKVSIGTLRIAFPKQIVLKDVYFEDQHKDTLLAGKELRVDIALLKLLSNEVNVDYLELNGIRTNIYRIKPDTVFNYDYIVKAFATEQKTSSKTDTASTLKFHLNRIVLKDILTTFKDDETGNDVYFYLGNFETRIKTFDPDHLVYDVPTIAVSNINARIYQYKPLIQATAATATDTSAATAYPTLHLDALNLSNINFNYRNDISALLADLHIGELITHPQNLNLQSLLIQLKDVQLKNTSAKIVLGKTQQAKAVKDTVANKTQEQLSNPWKIELAKVDFSNDNLIYDDNSKPKAASGMDFSHLNIRGFVLNADSLIFTPTTYAGNINQLAFNEQSGFNIKKFQTKFIYNDKEAALQDLLLQTDNSVIRDRMVLTYPSQEALTKDPGSIYVDANLSNTYIAVKDILAFMPGFKRNMKGHEQSIIHLNTSAKGYVRDLAIPNFEMSGFGRTYVKLSGNIKGLPDTKHTYYNIKIAKITSTKNDVLSLLPPKTLPSSMRLPDVFALTGFFNGSMNGFNTQLALRTNKGNVDVKGNMNGNNEYAGTVALRNVDAGYLMKQDTMLGRITMNAKVSGAGLDMKTATVHYDVTVDSAVVKGYQYNNFVLNGDLNKGIVHSTANINDQNIKLNLDATADIKPKYPSVKLDLLIDTLNMKALHLMTDTLNVHGHLAADMQDTNPDSLNGTVNINNLIVTRAGQVLSTDSLSLIATAAAQQKSIVINSDALKASLTGQFKLTEFAQALQKTINRYYNLPGFKDTTIAAQNWELNATIIPTGLLLQLMPSLAGSDSTIIHTTFNSAANDLNLSVKNRLLVFNGQNIDSLNVFANTNSERLNYGVAVNAIRTPSMHIHHTSLNGFVANNQLDFNLNAKDQKNKTHYALAGLLSQITNGVKLSLKPDSAVLDYMHWDVGNNNFIEYDSIKGILVNNFSLSNAGQLLSINSTSQTMNAPVKIDFKDFQISTITKIANQDSLLLQGVINGNAVITDPIKNPVFTSDLHIDNVIYQQDTIGNLAIQVNNQQANAFAANVSLLGNNTDLKLNGMYYTGEGRMDLKLNMNQVNLAIVKPFAAGQLKDISGYLKGNVNIGGTIAQPAVNGDIRFENASITPTISGETFKLPNDAIAIDSKGIHFNQFTLLDSANNKAVITGDVLTTDFKNYSFNVDLNAQNFTLVNTPKTTNQLVYGKLNIDTRVKLRGDMNAPTADAYLRINKETNFAMVLPSTNPEVVSREGVVKFVDKDHPGDTLKVTDQDTVGARRSALKGIDVTATIETDSSAQLTLVIDESNGDALTVKGRANLAAAIDPSGKTSLTGNYELTSGSYQISMTFLKRKFDLQRGSTITWTGDPMSANINITATYLANVPSIDLVEQQLGNTAQTEMNRYKQKLPFNVNLIMTGELMKPIIAFDITLPEDVANQWPVVDARLQQVRAEESELNKQVFALLLLGRFVGENPFQSSAGGGGTEAMVRQSASRLLTDQMNQLAGNLIKGVDINFNLTSETDYSTGQAANLTQLNVGVSKRLMNDRLKVNVGSNFELEGPQNSNRNASNIAGDVSIDYQITRDGRYMIRGYRKNQYEGVIEGQVIETGVTFMLSYDYNKLSELFMSRKEKKEIKNTPPVPSSTNNTTAK